MFLSGEICAAPGSKSSRRLKVVLHFQYQWKQEGPNNEDKEEPSSDLTRGNPLMPGEPHLPACISRGIRTHEDHRFNSPYGWCRVSIT
jgi:hypothetical protein